MKMKNKEFLYKVYDIPIRKHEACTYYRYIPHFYNDIESEMALNRTNPNTGFEYEIEVIIVANYSPGERMSYDSPGSPSTLDDIEAWHCRKGMWHQIDLSKSETYMIKSDILADYEKTLSYQDDRD